MNSLCIIGRLTADYGVKYSKAGKPIGSFSLAVQDGFGDNEHCSFYNVVTFGNRADKHGDCIRKGSKVGITGSIRQDRWEAQDGSKRSAVKIIAHNIEYLDGKKESTASSSNDGFDSVSDDEIPF